MTNWCANQIEIIGSTEVIAKFISYLDTIDGDSWFSYFRPRPVGSNWAVWNHANWGVGEDAAAIDWTGDVVSPTESMVTFTYYSKWTPPIELYNYMTDILKLKITASYYEGGMGFVGQYHDGNEDCYTLDDVDIPEKLIEEWNLNATDCPMGNNGDSGESIPCP